MKHSHRLPHHHFRWIPPSERPSRIPGMPKKSTVKMDTRTPNFWLALEDGEDYEQQVYFVNQSNEIVDKITVESGGYFMSDDDLINLENNNQTNYTSVLPGEAVLVDQFNRVYDSDFYLFLSISVDCKSLGHVSLTTESNRGSIASQVLVWNTWEIAKGITMG